MRWLICLLVLWCGTAHAHQTSVKYVDLAVEDDAVNVRLRFSPGDVTEPMGLPADATPELAAALAHPAVPAYVQTWVVLTGCETSAPAAQRADNFIAVTWTATCENPRQLAVDFTRFFALDARHEAVVRYTAPHAEAVNVIVRANEPQVTLRAGHSSSYLAWIRTGMDHIYGGIDHILFVLSLLLVVVLYGGGGGEWHTRAFLPTLRSTALVITAFTIAHSITLIAAALGLITLPSQLVETIIALSIAYTAAEDVVNPAVRWRFWLTFAFGLIHGMGFASQLALLLPPTDVVMPLLCFNIGVEIGQLSIVLVALPILFALARAVGAARYRHILLPLLATPIFLCGIIMVIERVFEISLLPM